MATRLLVLIAALAAAAAAQACPAPPKAIPRPAVLGPVFPTPPGYFYTSGRRRNGAAIVTGYMKVGMTGGYAAWWSTITGSGRYHGFPFEGKTHTIIRFTAWKGAEHGQVDVWLTCKNRVTAVITYYAR